MYCPRCGQERISQETSFCSRCGFLLTAAAELLVTGGVTPQSVIPPGLSARRRGIRKGLFMIMLMIVFAPLFGIIAEFGFGMEPWPAGVAVLLFGGGGLLRIAYALMFESKYPAALSAGTSHYTAGEPLIDAHHPQPSLYPQRDVPVSEYTAPAVARPLKTNDLEPSSVTEPTTRLLEKDR